MKVAAVVYGEQSGILRRIVVTDEGIEKLAGHYGKDESIIILNADEVMKSGVPDLPAAIALVEKKRGKPSENDRCIVVDPVLGIERVIKADPAIDTLLGKEIIQDPTAEVGWTKDTSGKYVPPSVAAPAEEAVVN